VSIKTNPPDAKVEVKDAGGIDSKWRGIGSTPVSAVVVPQGPALIRFSLKGYITVERLIVATPELVIHQELIREGELPENMLVVSEVTPSAFNGIRVKAASFLADKCEVTNRQFQAFVDAGGYETPDYWKHEFYKEGRKIAWQEAINEMRDRTGQPGPATWQHGRYPEREDDYPVRGVSWYEAAAYAEFAHKSLPTIHHWATAASLRYGEHIAPFGNYSGSGPAKVGQYAGITESGLYDMAGNVKEWCWNETESGGRWIRGGSWREPTYMFGLQDAASPFLRLPDYGFRCVRYIQPPTASALAAVPMTNYRYKPKEPATPEQIELYRRHFLFDKQRPLNATKILMDRSNDHYDLEIVEIDAAYEDERFKLHLFHPRGVGPPLLPILYHPGAGSMKASSMGDSGRYFDIRFVSGLVRRGHVVCWPVYKGTYERRLKQEPYWNTIDWRDLTIQRTKDLIRAVDYLETRPDLRLDKLAFVGFSFGAGQGPLLAAIEPRLRLCAFTCGGLFLSGDSLAPEINPYNFAPEVEAPVLMINGRFDQFFPLDQSQIPLFERLGSQDKTHYHFDSGHATPEEPTVERVNDWLNQHTGGPSHSSPAARAKGAAIENASANEPIRGTSE
jgi:dienelactone hydrolase